MNDPNMFFVCAMGMGVVFVGLILLVFISMAASSIIRKTKYDNENKFAEEPQVTEGAIENRQEFVAAVSAVIAEQLGTNVDAIKIKSIKKV